MRCPPSASLTVAVALIWAGCAASEPGPRDVDRCVLRAWYSAERARARPDIQLSRVAAEHPELIGSWNGWQRPGIHELDVRPAPDGELWSTATLPLPPGQYLYGILAGPYLLPDNIQPQSAFAPDPRFSDSAPYEAEFSLAEIPDCTLPTLDFLEATAPGSGSLRFVARFVPGRPSDPLDPSSIALELRSGGALQAPPRLTLAPPDSSDGSQRLEVTAGGLPPGKYTLIISLRSQAGRQPPPASASLFVEPEAPDPQLTTSRPLDDAVIYQLVIDRFRGPAGPLSPPPTPGLRAGGTLGGVRQAVESGYFQRLGVTTLWLSPLYQNPTGTLTGRDGHTYEAYHGYWPTEPRRVEPQLGGEAELAALVAATHARGLRVIFDAVPNHVYRGHPYYREHSRQVPAIGQASDAAARSWFNDGQAACICGAPGCDWGSRIEDCWFDAYLPDLNWRHPMVMQSGSADLLWWLQQFDLDGMRIDAVPMMPRAATRRIVRLTRQATFRQGLDRLVIGEDYTGPGDAGRVDIRSFLGQKFDGLDSAFDFPLMWAMRSALAQEHSGLDELEREIAHSQAAWAGSGAVMAHILDNHDTARFLSEAAGNAGNDPWKDPPPQPDPSNLEPYRKQVLGLTLLFTLPGIPVLYYGDELALAGATDPDSRRTLPDILGPVGELPSAQAEVLATTRRLGQLRACLPALRRGVRTPLASGPDYLASLHKQPDSSDGAAVVILSRSRNDKKLFLSGIPDGLYRDALGSSSDPLTVTGSSGTAPITARALRAAIYLPDGHRCL